MKKVITGASNKVLEVDLTSGSVNTINISERERRMYIGAKGLGLKLLYERMIAGVDPLGKDNIIAFMPGVLMGTGATCSGRFDAVTKSPLTGIMISSSCGGAFGMNLKTAGWDGLIIKGRSEKPSYLYLDEQGVKVKDAASFWGKEISETRKLVEEPKTGSLVIGPAGENLVKYANIASGHRFLGRGGMGAVLGSKNIKAIVAKGGAYKIKPADEILFKKIKKKTTAYIKQNQPSKNYKKIGTNANLVPINNANMLPVNNFQDGRHDKAYEISGEKFQENHDTSYNTCKPCTIMCGHKGKFNSGVESVPEYETVGLLGSNLGIFDREVISNLNKVCSELGIDTISAGGTLAWAMEASEKGLINSNLKFGNPEGISEMLYDIANRQNLGADLAEGSRAASEKYGGKEFAIHVKGLEMAAYDPRGSFGQGLAYAVANRGACHLSAYLVALEIYFKLLPPDTVKAKPEFVKFFEDLTCCINSLQTCQFTMFAYTLEPPLTKYTPDFINAFFMRNIPKIAIQTIDFSIYTNWFRAVTGIKISGREFLKAGERTHVLERYMNTREGISVKNDTLPVRMLEQGRLSDDDNSIVPLEQMLEKYYKLRGYDPEGRPGKKLLEKLGIK